MKDNFPSILDLLTQAEKEKISFVCPTIGSGVTEQCTSDSASSPAAKDGSIRNLRLGANQAVPFHRANKEKLYVYRGVGRVDVFIFKDGNMHRHWLENKGDILVIPKGCPHAILTNILPVEITVIMYPKNPTVVTEWEPTTEELISNEHLYAAD